MAILQIVKHFNWHGPIGCGLPAVVQQGVARTAANIDPAWIGIDVQELLAQITGCRVHVINDADAAGIAEMRYGVGRDNPGTTIMVTVGTGLGTALFRNGLLFPNTELGHMMMGKQIAEKYASAAVRKEKGLSYQSWAERFDRYLHVLQQLFWPDLFIIGGGISKKYHKYSSFFTVQADVQPAALGNEAGIVGAAAALSLIDLP
jgi:polyphosphate glucokinase